MRNVIQSSENRGSIVFRHASRVLVVVAVAGLLTACSPPTDRLNSPPQGWTSRQAQMQEHYVYMVDNAMLGEMNLSDVHFVPHSDELNSLGARRLDRYASLLKEYGGQLNYDTEIKEAALINARLAKIRKYLEAAGMDMEKVSVEQGPVGVCYESADEAIAARNQLTLSAQNPRQQSSGGGGGASRNQSGSGYMMGSGSDSQQ
jgi:hypothetical protein